MYFSSELMEKFSVVIFVLFLCGVPSTTFAINVSNILTDIPSDLPTLSTDQGDGVKDAWNSTLQNLTSLFYDDNCNITACNPIQYKDCYDDKEAQLVVHAIAVLLGTVLAFFGKERCNYINTFCFTPSVR